jgi:hypothetical protein
MNIQNVTELKLDQNENCFTAINQHYNDTYYGIKVPKIMPMLLPKANKVFNKNILINDASCKPSINGSVSTQEYITVRRSANCSLAHKANIYGIVSANTPVTCTCLNGNIKNLVLTDCF